MTKRTDTFDLILNRLEQQRHTNPKLEPAFDDLHTCAPRFREAVAAIMFARKDGLAAAAYDGPSVTVGGKGASTVERLAGTVDRTGATRDLLALDDALRKLAAQSLLPHTRERWICTHARTLWRITSAWTPHAPSDKQRTEVARTNDPEAECAHHRLFGSFEPVHRTTDGPGLLPHPLPLCRWCYDRLRTDGVLPTADRMQRLATGRADRVRA